MMQIASRCLVLYWGGDALVVQWGGGGDYIIHHSEAFKAIFTMHHNGGPKRDLGSIRSWISLTPGLVASRWVVMHR